jgi:hypothetical protein
MEDDNLYANILQDCFTLFRDHIDVNIIRGDLIENRIITIKKLKKIQTRVRAQSCENLLFELIVNMPNKIKPFLDIVKKDHYFLIDEFQSQFYEKYGLIKEPGKLKIFTNYRKSQALPMRHELKLLSHKGEITKFNSIITFWKNKWESCTSISKTEMSSEEKSHLADMYFMTLDAQLEHRRVICDRELINDEILFNKVKDVAVMTSQPYLSYMMYLARHGSAKRLAGMPLDDSIKEVEEALSRFNIIPACRETGIVLYIHFNMVSSGYEKKPTESKRKFLLETATMAIDHFGREDENMGEDFRRMVLTKIALVNLGIGVFGDQISGVLVTKEQKEKAIKILNEIQKKHLKKMEIRWKMFFYIAKTKVHELDGNILMAFKCISKALKFSERGRFAGEGVNIKKTRQRLYLQQKIAMLKETLYLLWPLILSCILCLIVILI